MVVAYLSNNSLLDFIVRLFDLIRIFIIYNTVHERSNYWNFYVGTEYIHTSACKYKYEEKQQN